MIPVVVGKWKKGLESYYLASLDNQTVPSASVTLSFEFRDYSVDFATAFAVAYVFGVFFGVIFYFVTVEDHVA